MKTLVTGATGFIGKNLIQALLEKGRSIRLLIKKDQNTDTPDKNTEIIYADLTDKKSLSGVLDGVDIVYHLAAAMPYISQSKENYYQVNVLGTKNLLEECQARYIKRFIYFSSISAVGPQYRPVLVKEDSVCNPLTYYGKSKYLSEKIALDFFKESNIPVVIIRCPMVYGPGDVNGLLKVFQLIQKKLFIPVKPMRSRIRSLCYIGNLINASFMAESSSNAVGNIYFVSDKEQHSLGVLFDTISQELGVTLSEIELPYRLGIFIGVIGEFWAKLLNKQPMITKELIRRLCVEYEICDIGKARRDLGYSPSFSLREGVSRTIQWYRQKGLLR